MAKGSRGGKRKPKAMTEQEYLDSKGVGSSFSNFTIDKTRGNRQVGTVRGKKRFEKEFEKTADEYYKKRTKAKEEYKSMLKSGKVRDKTSIEKSFEIAQGNPDLASTQAARRMMKKRGYDWKTGKKLK